MLIQEFKSEIIVEEDDGVVPYLKLEYKGNLNALVNEFFDGTKKPRIYKDLIEAIKQAKLYLNIDRVK